MLKKYFISTLFTLPIATYSQINQNSTGTISEQSNSGTHNWVSSTLGNGYAEDNLFIQGNDIEHVDETSNILRISNFNFSFPANALITEVKFTLRKGANGGDKLVDQQVRLETYGSYLSNNLAESGNWTQTITTSIYRGDESTWGIPLTADALNRSDFAILLQAGRNSNSTTSNQSPEIDFFSMQVSYSEALPIQLINFAGLAMTNGDRQLSWGTASEINNSHFLLERKTDQEDFATIARIEGAGNSISNQHYTFYDRDYANNETVYYRLKQVDFDGKETDLGIISVHIDEREDFTVYPNPSIHYIIANSSDVNRTNSRMDILEVGGQLVHSEEYSNHDIFQRIQTDDLKRDSTILSFISPMAKKVANCS